MDTTTTRRAMFGILATPALALAIPAAAKAEAVDRSAWDQAFAAMKKAEAALNAHGQVFDRVHDVYRRAHPDPDMIDWTSLKPEWVSLSRQHKEMEARCFDVQRDGDMLVAEAHFGSGSEAEKHKAAIRAALDQVREYQRLEKDARAISGYDAECEKSDELAGAFCDARFALVEMPAPDLQAIQWKMEMMFGDADEDDAEGYCPSYRAEYVRAVLADLRHLVGEARHV